MPGGIGPLELAIVLIIVLVVFGPKRLPSLGRQLGSGMREFKDSITSKHKDDDDDEDDDGVQRRVVAPAQPAEPSRQASPAAEPVAGEVRAQDQPVVPREQ
jgi:sec-independent protein translocase protein TatA